MGGRLSRRRRVGDGRLEGEGEEAGSSGEGDGQNEEVEGTEKQVEEDDDTKANEEVEDAAEDKEDDAKTVEVEDNDTAKENGEEGEETKQSIIDVEEDENQGGERENFYDRRSSLRKAAMDCGTCFSKYILCLFNFIILVCGAGVLFLGVWMYADKDSLFSFAKSLDESTIPQLEKYTEPEMSKYISFILMAVGGAMFVLSILGYCGALRESRCLLGFYGFLLVVILLLEITAGGLAFFYKDMAETEIRGLLKDSIKDDYVPDPAATDNHKSGFLNLIMVNMQCCGVDNYTDFQESKSFVATGLKVPPACCVYKIVNGNHTLIDPDCPKNPSPENSYYLTGCYQVIMNQIKEHMNIVIYVVAGLVAIELLSTFLAFCLCKSLAPYDK